MTYLEGWRPIKVVKWRRYWQIEEGVYYGALHWQQMETFARCSSSNKGKYHHSTSCFYPWPCCSCMCVCVCERELTPARCRWYTLYSLVLMNRTLTTCHSLSHSLSVQLSSKRHYSSESTKWSTTQNRRRGANEHLETSQRFDRTYRHNVRIFKDIICDISARFVLHIDLSCLSLLVSPGHGG